MSRKKKRNRSALEIMAMNALIAGMSYGNFAALSPEGQEAAIKANQELRSENEKLHYPNQAYKKFL